MKNIEELQQIIGYHFKDLQLLVTALTHSSYLNESKGRDSLPADNERLEFFGDAIIEFYVSDYLFHKYDDTPEGDMTKLRASMVCEQSLAECSRQIGLGSYLNMGKGEESSGGRERPSITSDAFEALTAAIYLDSGKEAAEAFIQEHLIKVLEHKTLFFDAKTRLQEIIQKDPGARLTYELLSEEGPSHNKLFTSAVLLNGREIGRGSGHSKKLSQQEAAVHAMETITQEEI
ncbi:MAG: ribonuclease III [Parasporobacterium sp.]|nr:ribonuclease III [Parasporobacterium sp.]